MSNGRRKLLKALALYGGAAGVTKLPDVWSKPLIKSAILPVHAQSSSCTVEVTVLLSLGGNYTGSVFFSFYSAGNCIRDVTYLVPVSTSFSFPSLAPGTYYLDGGGAVSGSDGSGESRITVSCCNGSDAEGISSPDSYNLGLIITVGNDGNCAVQRGQLILNPC